MKKYLGFIVMALVILIPIHVFADTTIKVDSDNQLPCTTDGEYQECTVQGETSSTDLVFTLTFEGGAEYLNATGEDWSITPQESSNVVTIEANGLDGTNVTFFTFKFKNSGQEDCGVKLKVDNKEVKYTPTPTTTTEKDTKTDSPDTGISMPYIALGAIAIIAGCAYVATKNKAKMYRL